MPSTIGPFSNVPAAGDPTTSAWARQLTQYAVDNKTAGDTAAAAKVNKAGDTLTGDLHAGPHLYAEDIIHFGPHWLQETDDYLIVHSDKNTYIDGVNVFFRADGTTVTQQSNAGGTYFPLPVSLENDPTAPLHVATKRYVDTGARLVKFAAGPDLTITDGSYHPHTGLNWTADPTHVYEILWSGTVNLSAGAEQVYARLAAQDLSAEYNVAFTRLDAAAGFSASLVSRAIVTGLSGPKATVVFLSTDGAPGAVCHVRGDHPYNNYLTITDLGVPLAGTKDDIPMDLPPPFDEWPTAEAPQ